MIVARPWVRQCRGTSSTDPPKKRALSSRVCLVRVLIRVRERERRARLVERDVPVGADAEDLQVDAAGVGDARLVRRARRPAGPRQAVRALHRPGREVDAGRELLLDDVAVPLGVVGRQAHVLVEHERPGPGEREAFLVPARQLVVHRERGRAGGQPQDRLGRGRAAAPRRRPRPAGRARPAVAMTTSISFSFPERRRPPPRPERGSVRAAPAPPA